MESTKKPEQLYPYHNVRVHHNDWQTLNRLKLMRGDKNLSQTFQHIVEKYANPYPVCPKCNWFMDPIRDSGGTIQGFLCPECGESWLIGQKGGE